MIFTNDQSLWNDNYQAIILPPLNDDIKPIYQIDTYGTIINLQTNTPIIPHMNDHGYWFSSLMTNSGTGRVHRKIHRLVLMSFNYIPGCESLHANHIDGNKRKNHLDNLNWMTPKENKNHGMQSKQKYFWFGDHDPLLALPLESIYSIGKMIMDGVRADHIIRSCPILDIPTLYQIGIGAYNPQGIFTQIEIDKMTCTFKINKIPDYIAHKFCQFYQDNKNTKFSSSVERNAMAITFAGMENNVASRRIASTIYNRYEYISISKDYDF